jgi:hypothetical protein
MVLRRSSKNPPVTTIHSVRTSMVVIQRSDAIHSRIKHTAAYSDLTDPVPVSHQEGKSPLLCHCTPSSLKSHAKKKSGMQKKRVVCER